MGCVCHDPRLPGHVCPNPQTTAAGPRGMGATTPVFRGMCAPTPKRPGRGSLSAATCHVANVACGAFVTDLGAGGGFAAGSAEGVRGAGGVGGPGRVWEATAGVAAGLTGDWGSGAPEVGGGFH